LKTWTRRYVELLKSEKPMEPCCGPGPSRRDCTQHTRSELERTILALKNLVEKLQAENKTIRQSMSQEDPESSCDCRYLRAEWERSGRRVALLETELELAQKRIKLMEKAALEKSGEDGPEEAAALRLQLNRKSELLLKVKDLLTKAALNEKVLRQRVGLSLSLSLSITVLNRGTFILACVLRRDGISVGKTTSFSLAPGRDQIYITYSGSVNLLSSTF
jgi:hypothetical protein